VSSGTAAWFEIVGVVGDVQSIDIAQNPPPYQLYQPVAHDPRHFGMLAMRLSVDPSAATFAAVRAAVARVDPDLVLRRLATAEERMQEVTSSMHLVTRLLTGFALLGLLLAGVGLYGVMSRTVAQRTDEIGVRMALGARAGDVLGLVLASASRLVAIGAIIGTVGAVAISHLLASVLPRLDTRTGAVTVTALLLLAGVALAASAAPARRAARVDPMAALRAD
jgi:predicted lysophospholipase L1 biosynthesis ABC-type transport system permease subunit